MLQTRYYLHFHTVHLNKNLSPLQHNVTLINYQHEY